MKNYIPLYLFFILQIGFCFQTHSQNTVERITLDHSNVLNEMVLDTLYALYDEQDSVGDPRSGNGGTPQTKFGPLNSVTLEPYGLIIDLGSDHDSLEFYACDNYGAVDTVYIYTGYPGQWTLDGKVTTDKSNYTWIKYNISDTSRFLKLLFHRHEELNEIALYGRDLETSPSSSPPGTIGVSGLQVPDFGNYFMGTCGFLEDPYDLLTVVATHRQYNPWDYFEFHGTDTNTKILDTAYEGYPNSKFKFNPINHGSNADEIYTEWKSRGIDVVPVLQQTASYLREGRNASTQPITPGDDSESPYSYEEHADFLFQFTARYGRQQWADSLLKLNDNQNRVSGLDLINYVENWNEQDQWWGGSESYFSPSEMAAMCSADYDGHEGQMGSTYGVKNADSTMKMVMGGLAILDVDYVKGMKLWSDYNRNTGFPADVINFHHYSNTGGQQRHNDPTVGVSPEQDGLKERLKEVVEYRDQWLPGVEVWITEFGYSTHPNSNLVAGAIGDDNIEEIQSRWLLRSFLEISAAGVDRAYQYQLADTKTEQPTSFAASGLVKDQWDQTHSYYIWDGDSIVDTVYHEHDSYEKKKSWYYLSCMKQVMSGYHFYAELESGHQDVNLYEFRDTAGMYSVYAAWCTTSNDQIIDSFRVYVGSDAYRMVAVTPDSAQITGSKDTLSINSDSVYFTVSEMPTFLIKTINDSVGPTAIAQDLTLYLNENGEASITAEEVNNGSYDNHGIVRMELSKTNFNCNDVTVGSTPLIIVSDSSWKTSTEVNTSTFASFPWSGVSGNLPDDTSFSINSTIGQPHSWHSIDEVDEAEVIKTGNYVTFHRKTFDIENKDNVFVRFQSTVDDDLEIYLNGTLIAREEIYNYNEGKNAPYDDLYFGEEIINGYQSPDTFQYVTSTPISSILQNGINTITVAVRNGAAGSNGSTGNIGGFSFKMTIEPQATNVSLFVYDHVDNVDTATVAVTVIDSILPVALAKNYTLSLDADGTGVLSPQDVDNGSYDNCNNIVSYEVSRTDFNCSDVSKRSIITVISDSSWELSSQTQPRSYPWGGLATEDIPHDSTFIYQAEEGQTVPYTQVHPVPGSQPIKAYGDVQIFRKSFNLGGVDDVEAMLQITGDDFFQVLINGTGIGLQPTSSGASSLPAHTLFYDRLGNAVNGYNSGDSFGTYFNGDISSVLTSGENTIVVAVSNGSTASGGFSLKLDVELSSTIPITLKVEDAKGDTAVAAARVKIIDTTAPSVATKNISVLLDSTGVFQLNALTLDSNSTDACGIENISITPEVLSCSNAGINTITFTVTDSSGNSSIAYPTVNLDTTGSYCTPMARLKATLPNTNLNSTEEVQLIVFPNPIQKNGVLQLNFEGNTVKENQILLQMYDVSGRLLLQEKRTVGSTTEIIINQPTGTYWLKVQNKDVQYRLPIIVN